MTILSRVKQVRESILDGFDSLARSMKELEMALEGDKTFGSCGQPCSCTEADNFQCDRPPLKSFNPHGDQCMDPELPSEPKTYGPFPDECGYKQDNLGYWPQAHWDTIRDPKEETNRNKLKFKEIREKMDEITDRYPTKDELEELAKQLEACHEKGPAIFRIPLETPLQSAWTETELKELVDKCKKRLEKDSVPLTPPGVQSQLNELKESSAQYEESCEVGSSPYPDLSDFDDDKDSYGSFTEPSWYEAMRETPPLEKLSEHIKMRAADAQKALDSITREEIYAEIDKRLAAYPPFIYKSAAPGPFGGWIDKDYSSKDVVDAYLYGSKNLPPIDPDSYGSFTEPSWCGLCVLGKPCNREDCPDDKEEARSQTTCSQYVFEAHDDMLGKVMGYFGTYKGACKGISDYLAESAQGIQNDMDADCLTYTIDGVEETSVKLTFTIKRHEIK